MITRIIKSDEEYLKITNATNYDSCVIIFNKNDNEDEIIKEVKRLKSILNTDETSKGI